MKIFRRVLLAAWALLAVLVLGAFTGSKLAARVLRPIASYFHLFPLLLLLATLVYGIMRLYRAGMSRR